MSTSLENALGLPQAAWQPIVGHAGRPRRRAGESMAAGTRALERRNRVDRNAAFQGPRRGDFGPGHALPGFGAGFDRPSTTCSRFGTRRVTLLPGPPVARGTSAGFPGPRGRLPPNHPAAAISTSGPTVDTSRHGEDGGKYKNCASHVKPIDVIVLMQSITSIDLGRPRPHGPRGQRHRLSLDSFRFSSNRSKPLGL